MADAHSNVMLVFPGQGAQYPGMGSDLYEAYDTVRALYDEAGSIVGYDMAELSLQIRRVS